MTIIFVDFTKQMAKQFVFNVISLGKNCASFVTPVFSFNFFDVTVFHSTHMVRILAHHISYNRRDVPAARWAWLLQRRTCNPKTAGNVLNLRGGVSSSFIISWIFPSLLADPLIALCSTLGSLCDLVLYVQSCYGNTLAESASVARAQEFGKGNIQFMGIFIISNNTSVVDMPAS